MVRKADSEKTVTAPSSKNFKIFRYQCIRIQADERIRLRPSVYKKGNMEAIDKGTKIDASAAEEVALLAVKTMGTI